MKSSGSVLLLLTIASVLGFVPPLQEWVAPRLAFDDAEALSYLSTMWAVQATVLALVYPIVIAFVTLLVQRLHLGHSVLHIYLQDSGALLSGSNALMLLLLIGFQYFIAPWTSAVVLLIWAHISAFWLLFNIGFSAMFLYRTFEFLRPARRAQTVMRYALNVAWPAEMERHLRVHLFDRAVEEGLLPGPPDGEPDQSGPTVWMGVTGQIATDSRPLVVRRFKTERTVSDVYFRPLYWATSCWLKRARQSMRRAVRKRGRAQRVRAAGQAILIYPLNLDAVQSGQTTLSSQSGAVPVSRMEQVLIRCSFRFGRKRRDLDLTMEQLFDDLKGEGMGALRSNDRRVFSRVLAELEALLVSLIKVSAFTNEAGAPDNYSNLAHRWSAFGEPVYERWTRVLMDLFREVGNEIASEEEYFKKLLYVPVRMFASLDRTAINRILVHLVDLPPILFSSLGDWWVRTLEQQGTMDHGPCEMATVRPPYSGTYESMVRSYVGAWESLKNECFLQSDGEARDWTYYRDVGTYFERHLQRSVLLVGGCVYRGDKTGAVWMNDVLLKWISELDYHFASDVHYFRREKFITFEVLHREWGEARTEIEIEDEELEYGNVQRSVLGVALRNYWTDACCLLAYLLSIWGRDGESEKNLAALLLRSLIDGRSLVGGSHSAQGMSPIVNADELLLSMLRQRYVDGGYGEGYRGRLDSLARQLAGITAETMVPGRVYGGIDIDDSDSFRDGQLALLLSVTGRDWKPGEGVERLLREWLRSDDAKLRSFSGDLEQWKDRLGGESFGRYENLFECLNQDEGWTYENAMTTLVQAIEDLAISIDAMRTEALEQVPISEERLEEIGAWASVTGFSQETGAFPLPLFGAVRSTTEGEFERRSFTLQRENKGKYTEPAMAQRVTNEREWFDRTIGNFVGTFLLRDALEKIELRDVETRSPVTYWEQVSVYAERAAHDGYHPLLLLENRTKPRWVYEWLSRFTESTDRPRHLVVRRDPQVRSHAYIGHMNNVAVYFAPSLSAGSSVLIISETLVSVCFREFDNGNKVLVEPEAIEGESSIINLKLSWDSTIEMGGYGGLRLVYGKKGQ
ncbi:MAG: hypothetical protein OXQ89_07935 [Rhodospirillaceae bacterium]|nr:hypothetical protein [Rhodospirillaceae bacterium]